MKTLSAAAIIAATVLTGRLDAQVTAAPTLAQAPALTLPQVDTVRLANGVTVLVARNAEVPLVQARLVIDGGARMAGSNPGLATFTADMLDEGAAGRDALQLAEAVAFLGASLGTGAGWENTSISLSAPKRTFGDAMAVMADVVLRPTFRSEDISRQRDLRLAAISRIREQPAALGQLVFFRNVYPASHPLHRSLGGDSTSTAALDSAAVRNFWNGASDPRRATLIMTGDVTVAEARMLAERHFGEWTAPRQVASRSPAASVDAAPRPATRIILVDKPGAAQSVIMVGAPGVDRFSPDYAALMVMNTVLGGSFSSRLNDILREQRGYTYGAGSGYSWSPVPGPFIANTSVRSDVTDSSLAIVFREFDRIRNEPVDEAEMALARNVLVLGSLGAFETAGQIAGAVSTAQLFGYPLKTIADDLTAMSRVTAADVQRVARAHLDPSRMTVVIVGDVATIRPGIERLGLGAIEVQQ